MVVTEPRGDPSRNTGRLKRRTCGACIVHVMRVSLIDNKMCLPTCSSFIPPLTPRNEGTRYVEQNLGPQRSCLLVLSLS